VMMANLFQAFSAVASAEQKWSSEAGPRCAQRPKSTGPTSASRNPSTYHARHIGNRSGIPLPVCCHHGGIRSKSTEPASDSQNSSSNHVGVSHTCVG